MQLTGTQFTQTTALMGNDLATFPDYPAEIRAPAGTTYGVSAFQINFASHDVMTPGDAPDVLVAMNPAALKVHLSDLVKGGTVVVNTGAFTERNVTKAGYQSNPLKDDTLDDYRTISIDVSKLTLAAVEGTGVTPKEGLRAKNLWILGLLCWMYGRDLQSTIDWLNQRFAKLPNVAKANIAALNAGNAYGETAELPSEITTYIVPRADVEPGTYRAVTGTEAAAWGLLVGAHKAGLKIFFGSYPITPASPILHLLSNLKEFGVITFQAEDEIAAICSAIGASFGGALGVTSSSGPGIALKTEAIGLAITTELPLVIINSQRGGPSTGLPTKTEQSDLYQAVYGRNGEAPLPVLSTCSPGDCFFVAIEAVRLAVKYMTPVILLTDGYIANAAEPWKLPEIDKIKPFPASFAKEKTGDGDFNPFQRDPVTLARIWAKPGTPGLEHRIGGLEKSFETGHISYDDDNHQKMTEIRAAKVQGIENDIPEQKVALGNEKDELAVVGWGSTFGPIDQAVSRMRAKGFDVSHIHIRYLNPFPKNLEKLLKGYKKVMVPEMNMGQLSTLLKDRFLLAVIPLNKVSGQPFKIRDIMSAIQKNLKGRSS
ncbi:MAG: 2-oxoacid:acceptor oxidoreductase subunit alpha [Proteobacteria bacterium]|nr:2-oxoacid:acceptor oxidoreductase subunit alpha [Pseudomonadota bacterium]